MTPSATCDLLLERHSLPLGEPVVVAHGGVDMEPAEATFHALEAATRSGLATLLGTESGIEAAIAAVAVLEDDPSFPVVVSTAPGALRMGDRGQESG